jgi:hypothetical protein
MVFRFQVLATTIHTVIASGGMDCFVALLLAKQ